MSHYCRRRLVICMYVGPIKASDKYCYSKRNGSKSEHCDFNVKNSNFYVTVFGKSAYTHAKLEVAGLNLDSVVPLEYPSQETAPSKY